VKPLGMTPFMQVIRPTRARDAIYRAVEEAISENMTVDSFRREAAECWSLVLSDKAKADARDWGKS
jgi:hypothetical protein